MNSTDKNTTAESSNTKDAIKNNQQYDGRQLKRIALTPQENYMANLVWTLFGLTFLFMTFIAQYKYGHFILNSWEEFALVFIQGGFGGLIITTVLIYYFWLMESRKDRAKKKKEP